MLQHLLWFYRFGGKQLYYFQTYDGQGEIDVNRYTPQEEDVVYLDDEEDDSYCESCVI